MATDNKELESRRGGSRGVGRWHRGGAVAEGWGGSRGVGR